MSKQKKLCISVPKNLEVQFTQYLENVTKDLDENISKFMIQVSYLTILLVDAIKTKGIDIEIHGNFPNFEKYIDAIYKNSIPIRIQKLNSPDEVIELKDSEVDDVLEETEKMIENDKNSKGE